jgi:hypothetical protein
VTDERCLTAHHEAGHAVAVVLAPTGELISITIDPTPERFGNTEFRAKSWEHQRITFAGPWAEARCRWTPESLDDQDGNGLKFCYYLRGAFSRNRDGDLERYQQLEEGILPDGTRFTSPTAGLAQLQGRPRVELIAEREQTWSRELEERWPLIRRVAGMLLDGCTDVAAITAAVAAAAD